MIFAPFFGDERVSSDEAELAACSGSTGRSAIGEVRRLRTQAARHPA